MAVLEFKKDWHPGTTFPHGEVNRSNGAYFENISGGALTEDRVLPSILETGLLWALPCWHPRPNYGNTTDVTSAVAVDATSVTPTGTYFTNQVG